MVRTSRFGLEIKDLTDLVKDCGFSVFTAACEVGSVRAITVPDGAAAYSRKELDKLTEFVKGIGAKGLAWAKVNPDGIQSSFAKFMTDGEMASIVSRAEAKEGDLILIVADPKNSVVLPTLGALRGEVAKKLDLIPEGQYNFLWITEFPFFEWDEDAQTYVAMHHPFASPMDEDIPLLDTDKGKVLRINPDHRPGSSKEDVQLPRPFG